MVETPPKPRHHANAGIHGRALAYVLAMPPSVATQHGHDRAFAVAAVLVHDFALDPETALAIYREWNTARATPPWSERELQHKIQSAISHPGRRSRGALLRDSQEKTWERETPPDAGPCLEAPPKAIPDFSQRALDVVAGTYPREVTLDWLAAHSPVPIPSEAGAATFQFFIDTIYPRGEKILAFTDYYSQGNYLLESGGKPLALAQRPQRPAREGDLPATGREGVWFLTAPVTGEWTKMPGTETRLGRRHEGCCTRWPFILLESDKAEESLWLRALMVLPLPIVALYTSGGKSIHALVRVDCTSKAAFDCARDVLRALLCPIGADGAAMTAVRLSRLPGCLRAGKKEGGSYRRYEEPRLQRLVYLNPEPAKETALADILK